MFSTIAGALAGAAYGSAVGYIKYAALWKRILKTNKKIAAGVLYQHMGISYAINVVTLLIVFLLRNQIPWDFMIVIIAAAVMLSLVGKLAPMSEIVSHVEEGAS
ncbi:MAG: hypothetical protein IJ109_08910 [Firmicutes bacterium]|nr:hypothetical protein [Bacillota bacterium]